MPPPAVVAALLDDREPAPVRRACAEAFAAHDPPVPCETGRLLWGDVWLTCADGALVVAERKTPGDLVASVVAERLREQVAGCLGITPWVYVLVTGTLAPGDDGYAWWDGRGSRFRWEALQGALADVQQMGAAVLTCQGDADVAPTLLRLARRSREAVRLVPARPAARVDDRLAFLASLPGIGLEEAQALLEHCGSPAVALHCLTDGKALPPGVGPVACAEARRLLGLEDGFILALAVEEALVTGEEEDAA